MEQILCMVSMEAKNVLLNHQRENGFKKQGDALQDLLTNLTGAKKTGFMRIGAIAMLEALAADRIIPDGIIASKERLAEEAIRRHDDPMSGTQLIITMIEGESDE